MRKRKNYVFHLDEETAKKFKVRFPLVNRSYLWELLVSELLSLISKEEFDKIVEESGGNSNKITENLWRKFKEKLCQEREEKRQEQQEQVLSLEEKMRKKLKW